MERENKAVVAELENRQEQFGVLLGISPEKLRGLNFCNKCSGLDYEWTDWSLSEIDLGGLEIGTQEDASDYRAHLASIFCEACDGTGFEGGSFHLSAEQWIELGTEVD